MTDHPCYNKDAILWHIVHVQIYRTSILITDVDINPSCVQYFCDINNLNIFSFLAIGPTDWLNYLLINSVPLHTIDYCHAINISQGIQRK